MKRRVVVTGLLLLVCSMIVFAQTPADPTIGTWKLNLTKSKYTPGPPPWTSDIHRYEAHPSGFTVMSIWRVNAKGIPSFVQGAYKLDGKDYPLPNQSSYADYLATGKMSPGTTSVKVIDANTAVYQTKSPTGVPGIAITRTLSADKKTMTMTTKGKNARGQTIESIEVFDKVE